MPNIDKHPIRIGFRKLLIVLGLVALLLLAASCSSPPDEPGPTEGPVVTAAPAPTEAPTPTGEPTPKPTPEPIPEPEPNDIVNPVNGESPEDLNDTLRTLSEEDGVLSPTDGGWLYSDEEGDVTLSVSDPAAVAEALEAQPASDEEGTPSIITGVVGDTGYIAISSGGNVTVYITVGDQTVKAETEGKDGTKAIKKAASVASSAVTASKTKEAYERGRDDYDHNSAAYYMEAADCLIFYPAQLTKKAAFEDQSVIFSDTRSSVTCSVRLEFNPYRDIDELESLMAKSPYNTVLAWGDNWMTSESVRDGMVTFSYVGLGKKYMVTAELCYPRKYSFVFDELRELMAVRFLEGSKWVNGNRQPKKDPEYGAPTYGLQECFYKEFGLFLVLPDTLAEQAVDGNRIIFTDTARNRGVTVELFEIPKEDRNDIFRVFHVVARDGDLVLGDDYVRWHNSSGMYIGAVAGDTAALLRFEGGDAFRSYEAVYSELSCRLVDRYYEPQPLSDGTEEGPLEPQPTEGPEETPEPQPTEGPEETPAPQPSADPERPSEPRPAASPAPQKAPPRQEPNKIDRAVEKKVAEKAKEEYPSAPTVGSDPLEYYTDADFRAVNSSLEAFVDAYLSEEELIAGAILKVLRYNGWSEAEGVDAEELMLALGELMEEIDDGLFELELFNTDFGLPADLFPYVCEALEMDRIPEYRNRPQSDPPVPEWLEDLRENEYYDEQDLDWDAMRQLLDEDLPLPDFTLPELDPDLFSGGQTGPGLPDGGRSYEPISWPEYGITFDEEALRETEEQVEWNYRTFIDLIREERPDDWGYSSYHSYDDYLLREEPDFGRIGEALPYYVGAYDLEPPEDEEGEEWEELRVYISEDGIWVMVDPETGDVLDYGIMVPDKGEYNDIWYTITTDGEFMTIFEFDYGRLSTSKYGWLGRGIDEPE